MQDTWRALSHGLIYTHIDTYIYSYMHACMHAYSMEFNEGNHSGPAMKNVTNIKYIIAELFVHNM